MQCISVFQHSFKSSSFQEWVWSYKDDVGYDIIWYDIWYEWYDPILFYSEQA